MKWQYFDVYIWFDEDRAKDYVADFKDQRVVGFSRILNYCGDWGWELVNVVEERHKFHPVRGGTMSFQYRAIFKRQVQDNQP